MSAFESPQPQISSSGCKRARRRYTDRGRPVIGGATVTYSLAAEINVASDGNC